MTLQQWVVFNNTAIPVGLPIGSAIRQFVTGTVPADGVTQTVLTLPMCPLGGNPATYVGVINVDMIGLFSAVSAGQHHWATLRQSLGLFNNAGTIDVGANSSPNNPFSMGSNKDSFGGMGGGGLTFSVSGGNVLATCTAGPLAGSPTTQLMIAYELVSSP